MTLFAHYTVCCVSFYLDILYLNSAPKKNFFEEEPLETLRHGVVCAAREYVTKGHFDLDHVNDTLNNE